MNDDGRMQTGSGLPLSCEVSADRRAARMQLPPLQLVGLKRPATICVDLDALALDALLQRLTEVRMQMLPAPQRN